MDTITAPYETSLTSQIDGYKQYVSKQIAAVNVPASAKDLPRGKKNFLTTSGVVFLVIGCIAFVVGLFISTGLWIAGATAIASGVYCMIKGKQQLELEAYQAEGNRIIGELDKIIGYVSKDWVGYLVKQNSALRADIVKDTTMTDADKVAALDKIVDNTYLHVDLAKIKQEMLAVDEDENVTDYKDYLPKVESELLDAVSLSGKAQQDIYTAIAGK